MNELREKPEEKNYLDNIHVKRNVYLLYCYKKKFRMIILIGTKICKYIKNSGGRTQLQQKQGQNNKTTSDEAKTKDV